MATIGDTLARSYGYRDLAHMDEVLEARKKETARNLTAQFNMAARNLKGVPPIPTDKDGYPTQPIDKS